LTDGAQERDIKGILHGRESFGGEKNRNLSICAAQGRSVGAPRWKTIGRIGGTKKSLHGGAEREAGTPELSWG